MVELIDTHAHLDFAEFDADREEVIRRAAGQGVTRIVTVGTGLESSARAIALAEKYDGVFASVGIHPNDCDAAPEDAMERLRELARHPKVVAIGETGLDYHYLPSKTAAHLRQLADPPLTISGAPPTRKLEADPSDLAADMIHKSRQALFFRGQLDLASELGKPVIIHQRDSFDDVLSILERYVTGEVATKPNQNSETDFLRETEEGPSRRVRGVFHCFGESAARAQRIMAIGFYVSFTGVLTFKNASSLRDAAAKLPLERVMVETDCPFLAPQPFRGKRCEPAHVRRVTEQLAEVKHSSFEDAAAATTATARRFFGV
jgi:TatD DNase family protein